MTATITVAKNTKKALSILSLVLLMTNSFKGKKQVRTKSPDPKLLFVLVAGQVVIKVTW